LRFRPLAPWRLGYFRLGANRTQGAARAPSRRQARPSVQWTRPRRRRIHPEARRQARGRGRGIQNDRRAIRAREPRPVEGSRPYLGALLLGYYTDDGKLTYAGRVVTGMPDKVLADLRSRLE